MIYHLPFLICRENKSDTVISCYLSLGSVQSSQKKFEMALDSYRTALQIAKQLGNKEYQLEALESLGITFAKQERFAEGKKMLREAYRLGRNDTSCNVTSIHRQLIRGKTMVLSIHVLMLCFHSY